MMKRFKVFKKLCSLALILSMLVSMIPINVFATPTPSTIDGKKNGKLTITKYDSYYREADENTEEIKTTIDGVEFTIYKVFNFTDESKNINYTIAPGFEDFFRDYFKEQEDEELETEELVEKLKQLDGDDLTGLSQDLKEYIDENDTIQKTDSSVTGKDGNEKGKAIFNDLALGYYLVVETKYPTDVVETVAAPFLVSVPMTNTAGTEWDYDIDVYPKNITLRTGLTLTKYGNDEDKDGAKDELQGAKFKLEKYNGIEWVCKKSTPDAENCREYTTGENGKFEVEGLARGEYRFVEISAPNGYIADTLTKYNFEVVYDELDKRLEFKYKVNEGDEQTPPTYEQTPVYNIDVYNEKPTMEKVALKETAGLGETVGWEITTTVPSLINKLKTFIITDTLTDGLEFSDDINLEVVQGKNLDNSDIETDVINLNDFEDINEFNFEENSDAIYVWGVVGNQLMIRFNPKKLTPSTDIVVSYDTKITSQAVIFPSGNENKAKLEYSISTSPNSTTGKIEDKDVVYSFGLQVNKTASDKTTMLAGAKFTLCKNGTTECHERVSRTDGIIQFPQLAAGNYVLTEVQAPDKYNLLKEPITIKITAQEGETGLVSKVTATVNGKEIELTNNKVINEETGEKNPYYELLVVNNKGFTLPETGGMGTVIFTVAGLGIMGLAGAAYIALKRKESQQ